MLRGELLILTLLKSVLFRCRDHKLAFLHELRHEWPVTCVEADERLQLFGRKCLPPPRASNR